MPEASVNKKDLIETLTKVLSTKKECRDAVEMVFSQMKKSLRNGDKVIVSGFGSFNPYIAKAKIGRNPKTGEKVDVLPRRKVRFRQSKDLL
jgi:nucleoid DNA-binding protein